MYISFTFRTKFDRDPPHSIILQIQHGKGSFVQGLSFTPLPVLIANTFYSHHLIFTTCKPTQKICISISHFLDGWRASEPRRAGNIISHILRDLSPFYPFSSTSLMHLCGVYVSVFLYMDKNEAFQLMFDPSRPEMCHDILRIRLAKPCFRCCIHTIAWGNLKLVSIKIYYYDKSRYLLINHDQQIGDCDISFIHRILQCGCQLAYF